MKTHSILLGRKGQCSIICVVVLALLLGCSDGSDDPRSRANPQDDPAPRLLVSELAFASSWLKGCVDTLAIREDWLYADEITYITCTFNGANSNLQGMEVFADMPQTSLVEMTLIGSVVNLDPIAGLTSLRTLNLIRHKLLDLSPIATLTQLAFLGLYTADGCTPEQGCDLRDITPLAELVNLKELIFNDRNSDLLSQIGLLTNLERLRLQRIKLRDLSWAERLTQLEVLDLYQTSNVKHYDIDGLVYLENLRELYLPSGNPKNDSLQPLASLTKLRKLRLCNMTLSDLSQLAGLVEMEELAIIECVDPQYRGTLVDINALSDMESLRVLSLRHQMIEDLSPLKNLRELESLNLPYNRIGDNTDVLADLPNLNFLWLSNNNIAYMPSLDSLTQLSYLLLDNNRIQNLQPLIGLGDLERLDIGNNGLSDISLLASISSVDTLDLGQNNITDLSPVREIQGLRILVIEASATNCDQINELAEAQIFAMTIEKGWRC